MPVSREMELRKLDISQVLRLSHILDRNDCWKRLMESIPKNIKDIQYDQVDLNSLQRKYSSDNVRQILTESQSKSCSPTVVLFDEWGTSGRKRATVNDLFELLKKIELYRAADFVATKLLNEAPPKRPATGPGALISTDIPIELDEEDRAGIEGVLDNVSYPNTSKVNAFISSQLQDPNRNFIQNGGELIKLLPEPHFSDLASVLDNETNSDSTESSDSDSDSDIIQFSTKTIPESDEMNVDANESHLYPINSILGSILPLTIINETVEHSSPIHSIESLSLSLTDESSVLSSKGPQLPDFELLQPSPTSTADTESMQMTDKESSIQNQSVISDNFPNVSLLNR